MALVKARNITIMYIIIFIEWLDLKNNKNAIHFNPDMHGNVSPRPEPIAMENDPGSAGPVAVVRLRSEAVVRPWTGYAARVTRRN